MSEYEVRPGTFFRHEGRATARLMVVDAVSMDGLHVFSRKACFKGWSMGRMYQAGHKEEMLTTSYVELCLSRAGVPQDTYQRAHLASMLDAAEQAATMEANVKKVAGHKVRTKGVRVLKDGV
jgi:arginine/lysine/ornithine decarboxylase